MTVPPINRGETRPTEVTESPAQSRGTPNRTRIAVLAAVVVGIVVWAVFVLSTAVSGVQGDPRFGVPGSENMPIKRTPFLGYDNWPLFFTVTFVVVAVVMLGYFGIASWRERTIRYELVVFAALVGVSWVDPLGNWVTQASFDPRFWHFPTSWHWANLAPGIEPVMVVAGYAFQMLLCALVARAVIRRIPAAQQSGKRALLIVILVACVIDMLLDVADQLFMMNAHMYVYLSHIPPALTWGNAHIPWMSVLYDTVGATTVTVLLWHAGRRKADEAPSPGRDLLRTWVILSAVLLSVIALGAILRLAGLMDATFPGSWPFPEMIDGRPA